MMPLAMLDAGKPGAIKRVGGNAETRQFLENLGFVPGTPITVITKLGGNVIVNVKESRVAISDEMARQIMI
ncbi:MAG: ferrous iron transport protein A [Clostridiales bacterium]|jgi:ferrous iron transport protein A|nr:ferrous iron transport protein A [Clostridiales bacterium]